MPDSADDVNRFESEIARLSARVEDLQRRVQTLENSAGVLPLRSPQASTDVRPGASRLSVAAINRAGAITLVIGVILFFKYASEAEWIGPAGRVTAGIFAGLGLIIWADRLRTSGQRMFLQGLAGCGLAILYVSFYAASAYYHLLLQWAAYATLISVSAVALILSLRHSVPAIAALGSIGALLAPLLLSGREPLYSWLTLPYLAVIDITAVVIALSRCWSYLVPTIGALTLILAWFFLTDGISLFVALSLVMAAAHLIGMRWSGDRPGHGLYTSCRIMAHVCLVATGLRVLNPLTNELAATRDNSAGALNSIFLAAYGLTVFIYGFMRSIQSDRAVGTSLLAIVTAKVYLWDVWRLPNLYRILAFLALGALLLAASWIYSKSRARNPGHQPPVH